MPTERREGTVYLTFRCVRTHVFQSKARLLLALIAQWLAPCYESFAPRFDSGKIQKFIHVALTISMFGGFQLPAGSVFRLSETCRHWNALIERHMNYIVEPIKVPSLIFHATEVNIVLTFSNWTCWQRAKNFYRLFFWRKHIFPERFSENEI